jgi:alpha-aminoadipic semialdehyde synthase
VITNVDRASKAGVILLNECGLDPGIDHMAAMQHINEVKEKGGEITAFVSWCGGLPAPECSANPLGYKFSWNPKGMLIASIQDARYRILGNVSHSHFYSRFDSHRIAFSYFSLLICIFVLDLLLFHFIFMKEVSIPGSQLFKHVQPVNLFPAFALEGIPNRNALIYAEEYNIQNAETVFRGTLRYKV